MNIKKGDTVKIITGKDKGKTGKVLKTIPSARRILVEGVNLYKKHVKPKNQNEKGQVISVPRSLDISNIQLVCPSCGKPTRIGHVIENDSKSRICKKCKSRI
ncbi:MAG TPA: 50S ribosomal protein L24 [Candidatus Paceibacterota bacterium]|nr:50S ribosomal protein L24 [Candidatus Paceibacterota bacterium]